MWPLQMPKAIGYRAHARSLYLTTATERLQPSMQFAAQVLCLPVTPAYSDGPFVDEGVRKKRGGGDGPRRAECACRAYRRRRP